MSLGYAHSFREDELPESDEILPVRPVLVNEVPDIRVGYTHCLLRHRPKRDFIETASGDSKRRQTSLGRFRPLRLLEWLRWSILLHEACYVPVELRCGLGLVAYHIANLLLQHRVSRNHQNPTASNRGSDPPQIEAEYDLLCVYHLHPNVCDLLPVADLLRLPSSQF